MLFPFLSINTIICKNTPIINNMALSNKNIVINNHIALNTRGIWIYSSKGNEIEKNNFILNLRQAFFETNFFEKNIWDKNYWNKPRILPKVIRGHWVLVIIIPPAGFFEFPFPSVNIDWYPAKEPYDI